MESGSTPRHSADYPPSTIANLIGTAIAVLTLALPAMLIARYSSVPTPSTRPAIAGSPTIIVRQPNSHPNER